jgi:multiple sugar transport system permease protein
VERGVKRGVVVPGATFRHVTVPALAPMLLMVSILTMAGHFQLFAEPYVMTQGGPAERTVTVLYLMYQDGFKWWSLGSASAVAFVLFLLMLGTSLLQARMVRGAGWSS